MSQLDQIIEPEIHDDELSQWLTKLAADGEVKTILEVGGSDGRGSTAALIAGMNGMAHLYSIEISEARVREMFQRCKTHGRITALWAQSTDTPGFMTEKQVEDFYNSTPTKLNQYPLDMVKSWIRQDLDYIKQHEVPSHGIEMAQKMAGINNWDLAVLDGSAFTGVSDLYAVIGAKFIVLDDICDIKHFESYRLLFIDMDYSLVAENKNLRNGYAIFKRK